MCIVCSICFFSAGLCTLLEKTLQKLDYSVLSPGPRLGMPVIYHQTNAFSRTKIK